MFQYENDFNSKEIITNTFSDQLQFNKEQITPDKFLPSFDIRATGELSNLLDVYKDKGNSKNNNIIDKEKLQLDINKLSNYFTIIIAITHQKFGEPSKTYKSAFRDCKKDDF